MLTVVSTNTETTEDTQFTIADDIEVISISHVSYRFDMDIEWNETNKALILTDSSENVRNIEFYYAGGFYDVRTM